MMCFTWYIQYTAYCHLALQAAAGGEVEVGVEEAQGEAAVAEQPGQRQQPPPPPARPSCRGQVRYTGEMVNIRCLFESCKFSQSWRRPLLGPSPGRKRLQVLSHLTVLSRLEIGTQKQRSYGMGSRALLSTLGPHVFLWSQKPVHVL